MAVPQRQDLEHYRGDTFGFTMLLWVDEAATEPADLTDATVAAQIRASTDASTILATFEITVIDNQILLSLTPAQTSVLPAKAVWDCQVDWINNGEQIQTVLAGAITVAPDVTRLG